MVGLAFSYQHRLFHNRDFAVGLQIEKANAREVSTDASDSVRSRTAKRWLWVSLAVNLGLLGYFKYANFFIDSWVRAWETVASMIPFNVANRASRRHQLLHVSNLELFDRHVSAQAQTHIQSH